MLDEYNSIKDQLDQQLEHIFPFSESSLSLIIPETQKHFKYAVLTSECTHYSKPVELEELLKYRKCPICNAQITSSNLIKKSPTQWAIQRFSEKIGECKVTQCFVINGYYFHNYRRDKKFYQILFQNDEIVKYLMEKKNDDQILSKYYQKKRDQNINQSVSDQYESICLLNHCKIHIPVRHQNCRHPECYDLVSLLEYTTNLYQNNIKEKQMKCCKDDCLVKFPMSFSALKNWLVVDFELLSLLRKSPNYCLQYYYQNQKDEKFHYLINGKDYFDEYIKKFIFERKLDRDLEKFYNSVLKHMAILQETTSEIQERQYRNKYKQINNIILMDPFINQVIEYPIRCINCPLNKCSDVRTYFCEVLQSKENFTCPLCNQKYDFFARNFWKLINCLYLDFNLYYKRIQFKYKIQNNVFNYEGDKYFLHSFQVKFISKEKQIQISKQMGENIIQYNNLKCSITNERLIYPLRIGNCQLNNYIDVFAYYQELQKIDFKSDHGLIFCDCGFCTKNPIYFNDIYQEQLLYDALFQEVLIKLKDLEIKQKKEYNQIKLNVTSGELEVVNFEGQFPQFIVNSEYQRRFDEQLLEGKYSFRIREVRQIVNDNQALILRQDGITKLDDDEIKRINENLAKNEQYSKYGIVIKTVYYSIEWIKNVHIQ